ncbi:regucalcin-like isoform X2 [Spodoptera litura]|nr:regucalcin-like isoform X2 [Spodoptera litura]XP_022827791.1 regucalcin-like isoform X2 [Spodoptera litura]
MSVKVQKITEPLLLGEGPHWDEQQQALFFVSIQEHTIHKYVPATGVHTKTKLGGRVGFIVPVEGTSDQFLVGVERKFQVISWDGADGSPATVVKELEEVDRDIPTNRINDGKADPRGRVFAGTMGHESPLGNVALNKGNLFRLDGGKVTKVVNQVSISNGLAWDVREKAMYYTDSLEKNIRRYDYNVDTGEISNVKYIFDFEKNKIEGVPDGTTIDTDGNLWVAVFEGSCILKINPKTGELLQKVPIPASQVTSATFGGPNYDIMFVTTASLNIREAQDPPCGSTFMVTGLGVKGYPNVNFKL